MSSPETQYLSAEELAGLVGCQPNSYACMCRWLVKHNWPYEANRRGFPQVLRAYHTRRLMGQVSQPETAALRPRPNFAALRVAA